MERLFHKNKLRDPATLLIGLIFVCLTGCSQIERPKLEPFYAATEPPRLQELRWSNGKTPRSLDPALAAAPPETDIVRAVYEGLTELDSRTLEPLPAVAVRWRSSKDLRTWTFDLRRDATWSNGEAVTAHDFVRSWKRLVELGEKTSNSHLFQHIVGMNTWEKKSDIPGGETIDFLHSSADNELKGPTITPSIPATPGTDLSGPLSDSPGLQRLPVSETRAPAEKVEERDGAVAVDDHTLRVTLIAPDKDFPKLVAHPIFRPVFGSGASFEKTPLDVKAPTNGPFRLTNVEEGSITLERSDTYWNREFIPLAKVRMVAAESAEAALQAYRRGDVDVVTNAAFEPVAVKLLAPFDDFRRMSHNALNFYEVNVQRPPFNDRRVRQALSLAIDREKLTDGDLQGITQPAYAFSPLIRRRSENITHDVRKASELLEKAGYPDGEGFPQIRLVINRNDMQQRVATSVTRMWKQNLNIDSEIVVKEAAEMDEIRGMGDFDLIRRGVVLPSNDETVNLTAVNGRTKESIIKEPSDASKEETASDGIADNSNSDAASADTAVESEDAIDLPNITDQALYEMTAIPLYFPISHSLIKPYVRGFEMNGLDAPSLKEVSLDNNWQPGTFEKES